MSPSFLFRLFGLGAIPRKLRPMLEDEQIIVADEGMRGYCLAGNVRSPGKRYLKRREGFSGCLVITKKRILCYTFGKRQINIGVDDPGVSKLLVHVAGSNMLSLSFESSNFRAGWSGVIELRFTTARAHEFLDVLRSLGVRPAGA